MVKSPKTIPDAQDQLSYETSLRLQGEADAVLELVLGKLDDVLDAIDLLIKTQGSKGGHTRLKRAISESQKLIVTDYLKRKGWKISFTEADPLPALFGFRAQTVHVRLDTPPPPKAPN